ncbi:MAG: hypothetical protein AAF581_15395 [Planctomycetota bacterium]
MSQRSGRIFEQSGFGSTKEWIYFCLEFDLQLCDGCLGRARKRPAAAHSWYCSDCNPVVHPDLIRAVRTRQNVVTTCELCDAQVPVGECWISEDCQRLYCGKHLQPIADADRHSDDVAESDTAAAAAATSSAPDLPRWHVREQGVRPRGPQRGPRRSIPSGVSEGIYDGSRLVEFDRCERWVL